MVIHDDDDTPRWLWLAVAAGILLAVWLASAVIA